MDKEMKDINDLPGEIWMTIPGFSRYEASNYGRIKSHMCYAGVSQRILKPRTNKRYFDVGISDDLRKQRHKLIHQLVMLAFVGPRPIGMEVCHNDGNKANNCLSNLRYDTREANLLDAINQGQIKRGIESAASKLEEEEVVVIRKLYHIRGISPSLLSKIFGVSISQIRRIVNIKSWKHIVKYAYPDHLISSYYKEAQ
jgi:hypothetical protein